MKRVYPKALTNKRRDEICDEAFRQYIEQMAASTNDRTLYYRATDAICLDIHLHHCCNGSKMNHDDTILAQSRQYIMQLIRNCIHHEYNRRKQRCQYQKTIKPLQG